MVPVPPRATRAFILPESLNCSRLARKGKTLTCLRIDATSLRVCQIRIQIAPIKLSRNRVYGTSQKESIDGVLCSFILWVLSYSRNPHLNISFQRRIDNIDRYRVNTQYYIQAGCREAAIDHVDWLVDSFSCSEVRQLCANERANRRTEFLRVLNSSG